MRITNDGLKMLARVFISCNPIHNSTTEELKGEFVNAQGLSENQLYLIDSAKSGKVFDYEGYVSGLPNSNSLPKYEKIKVFAERMGRDVIDEKVVLMFFGGIDHINKALADNRDFKINHDFGMILLFIHLVTPVKIAGIVDDFYEGTYVNAGCEVRIKGLVPLLNNIPSIDNIEIKIGDVVLTHYASIISPNVSEEMKEYLLGQQRESEQYMQACKEVAEMDFNRFWNLSKWTKQIANM